MHFESTRANYVSPRSVTDLNRVQQCSGGVVR